MPLSIKIPQGSQPVIVGGKFKAVFNDPTVAQYDFTNYKVGGTRYNVSIPLGLKFNPNYLYFFHQFNFSVNIDEATYLEAIDQDTVPLLAVKDSSTRKSIFYADFRLFRYFENSAIDSYHYSQNTDSELVADFACVLDQPGDLVGISEIYAQVSFSVYQIEDREFIMNYKNTVH
jgi:hypothetical protein